MPQLADGIPSKGIISDFVRYPGIGFSVLRHSQIPAVLVETGYVNSYNDEPILTDPNDQALIARGIAAGIKDYFANRGGGVAYSGNTPFGYFDQQIGAATRSLLRFGLSYIRNDSPQSIQLVCRWQTFIHTLRRVHGDQLALAGCEQVPKQSSDTAPAQSTGAIAAPSPPARRPAPSSAPASPPSPGATVYAYKLASGSTDADSNGLAPVAIKMSSGSVDAARVALQSLAEGPNSPLPAGTKILSVVIDPSSKLASVNFSPELKSNFHGGETEEAQIINSVLKTLGQFGTIDKVQFLIDGKPLDTLGGAQDLTQPLPTPQSSQGGGEFQGGGVKQ